MSDLHKVCSYHSPTVKFVNNDTTIKAKVLNQITKRKAVESIYYNIPVSAPNINETDVQAVAECVRSGWISRYAPIVQDFETKFAAYCGCRYGVSTCSASTALDLALQTLNISKGNEVIIPTFTMIATGNAVIHAGAKPVLVDCEPDTWCINVEQAYNKVTEKTKAAIPVHIYGHLCDMRKLFDLHFEKDIPIIEDAAEAHGSTYGYTKAGVLNEMAVYSFFANKNMTTGEGGIIVTNNDAVAKRAQWLKANAFGEGKNHFLHSEVANTVCMSAMQAALGLSQLKRLDMFVDLKRFNAKIYNAKLKDLADDGLIILPTERSGSGYTNSYWMYSILITEKYGLTRNQLIDALEKDGVETRTFFIPLHKQPCFKKYAEGQQFPVADRISEQGLNLPSSTKLTIAEIGYICDCIHKHAGKR